MLNEKNIIFPDNTTDIMFDILKHNGMEQAEEEVFKKIEKGEDFYGAISGRLIKKVGTGEISFEKFIEELSLQLKIEMPKAKQIAQEIKARILDHMDNPEKQLEKKEPLKVQEKIIAPKQKLNEPDDYRESVE
mgnify:CR=1 FL=1